MDIIHQQHIRRAVESMKLGHTIQPDASDHLIHEALTGCIDNPHAAVVVHQGTADSVHQVGFSHAHSGVDKQRIVAPRWSSGYRLSGSMSKLVASANHETLERKFWIQRCSDAIEEIFVGTVFEWLSVLRSGEI